MSDRKTASFVNEAMGMVSNGLSVVPVKTDKKPTVPTWKRWQAERMTPAEVREHFTKGVQIALIGGAVSENLECLDFDRPDLYRPFLDSIESINPDLRQRLTLRQKTPSGGYHLVYRCTAPVGGNTKLARSEKYLDDEGNSRQDVFIETRGEGGYFLIAPSSAVPHGGGQPVQYKMVGSFDAVPIITAEERDFLYRLARSFDEGSEAIHQPEKASGTTGTNGERPGDRFNRETDWNALLTGYGWTLGRNLGARQGYTRPGKTDGSVGATLHPERGLYTFSSSTPLPTEQPLTKFAVFAFYEHGGDFEAAARELGGRYGMRLAPVADQPGGQVEAPAAHQEHGQHTEIETQDWPVMDQAAFHGLAGDFVRLACRSSEADPAAVLATFLVRFGVECGRAPTLYVGDTKHHPRLAAVIVGASSKARKGTSAKPVARLFSDMEWLAHSSPGPFSSGEGIIYAVRDEVQRFDEKNGEMVTVDPGVLDKRLFVMDEEFAGALASTKREGNTLSMVIRCAWDDGTFDPLTKTNKIKATRAHVGWVSHITIDELHRKLGESEAFNGFANRILWVCARRSKLNPFPQPMPDDELVAIRQRLIAALEPTRGIEFLQMRWSEAARAAWSSDHYQRLTQDQPGLVGCVVNRAEAQVVRLAMIYCLLDGGTVIEEIHLNAALAFWNYCEQSARYVFHGRMEDTTAQTILEAARERDLTGADVHALFGNNLSKARLSDALSCLIAAGRITRETIKQRKGRPTTVYRFRQTPYEKNETNELNQKSKEPKLFNSLNSFNSLSDDMKTGLVEVEI